MNFYEKLFDNEIRILKIRMKNKIDLKVTNYDQLQ